MEIERAWKDQKAQEGTPDAEHAILPRRACGPSGGGTRTRSMTHAIQRTQECPRPIVRGKADGAPFDRAREPLAKLAVRDTRLRKGRRRTIFARETQDLVQTALACVADPHGHPGDANGPVSFRLAELARA
jgi:hypothetical protein